MPDRDRPVPPIHTPCSPTRRRLLLGAGALGMSSLLAACAARAPAGRHTPRAGVSNALAGPARAAVPALKPGARVAIVAPASGAPVAADDAVQWLLDRGYEPVPMPATRMRMEPPYDFLGGPDEARLSDLHEAFRAPDIGAIWCLQGGFGSWRLLAGLDYALIAANPKPFIGYSDITALHLALQARAGFVTFHGPMLAQDLMAGKAEPTESLAFAMVSGGVPAGAWIVPPPEFAPRVLSPGRATGRLIGGNLALISALMGTPYEIDTQDAVLFLEDVNEHPARLDRMLAQLRAAGKLEGVRAVLLGSFTRLGLGMPDAAAQSLIEPLLMANLRELNVPVLSAWPSGHGDPNLMLPLGARVTLDTARGGLLLEQAVVR